jgi:concanavalin A-like lectin/glucanase superfamily protein
MLSRRRFLQAGLLTTLLCPLRSHAAATWSASTHPLNDPHTCLGWWRVTPRASNSTWQDATRWQRRGSATAGGTGFGVVQGTTRPGGQGELACNGSTTVATLPVFLDNPGRISVSLWFHTTVTIRTGLVSKAVAYNGSNPGWFLRTHSDGRLGWWLNQVAGTQERGAIADLVVNDGLWHHVVVAQRSWGDPATEVSIWIDGVLQSFALTSSVGTLTSLANSEPVRLGGFGGGLDGYAGSLDDVRFYTTALTAEAVQVLFQAPRQGYQGLMAEEALVARAPISLRQRGPGLLLQ